MALQQARFSAAHARRNMMLSIPQSFGRWRVERRWNEALAGGAPGSREIAALEARKPAPLGEKERRHLLQLGADLGARLSHPAATAATRKRILRAHCTRLLCASKGLHPDDPALAGWGPHRAENLKINGAGKHRWTVPEEPCRDVSLARLMPTNRSRAPQSRRQADRARQRLDQSAGLLVLQPPRHCRLSRERMGRGAR